MPLLKKKPFHKAPMPESLRDDDEVFYCAVTNEIFLDYVDFSERMFLCNSMVWTCSMTGKANLTYAEALESEENAKESLKEFPSELKLPVLYLASKTKRTAFGDMAEDVFTFIKDRYFIGENVETSFTGTKWKDSHVLQVIAPTAEQLKFIKNGENAEDRHHHLPANLYKYEIEHLDADDKDISEIMIVDCNQIRRKKGWFSREKCKLFLKQYVEQDDRGIFVLKPSSIESFKINKISFDQIFNGPPPVFDASKKFEKVVNGKKTKQESLHKFLTKNNNQFKSATLDSTLLEKMRKREEEFKLQKQQQKEEELAMKQKIKEENLLLEGRLKDWYIPKEDLELVDHKKLPVPSPVALKIPDKCIGDILMLLEFVKSFSKFLSPKDFFPNGLTLKVMERALLKNEVAGPLIDLIQMLLTALFNVQDEEASQCNVRLENPSSIKHEDNSDSMNLREATRLATIASAWSKKFQGLPLGRLPLYSLTTSEILRLHLLGSGAVINMAGTKWRYQQRGGYTSEDDPGLYLRVHSPHILKALETHNVVELPIEQKLEILTCLVNQLLTYADVRDELDERGEKVKKAKMEHRATLIAEKKREEEFLAATKKWKRENANSKDDKELKRMEFEAEKKKAENAKKLEELEKAFHENQIVMGYDRALRQYIKIESIPGFFVNFEVENRGTCLGSAVKQQPALVNATREETLEHIKKTFITLNSSNKENSPLRSPKKPNGINNSFVSNETYEELMLCSASPATCSVHSSKNEKKWHFYTENEKFDELIESLNPRGVRESELQKNLKVNKEKIEHIIKKTPITLLNSTLQDGEEHEDTARNRTMRITSKAKYTDANLGYPQDMNPEDVLHNVLVENILKAEANIFAGNLGRLQVKDRIKWRTCLQNKNYKELDKTIVRRHCSTSPDSKEQGEENGLLNNNGELPHFYDPGQLLNSLPDIKSEEGNVFEQRKEIQEALQALAIALIQVAQAVEPKYLKKPLGRVAPARSNKKNENKSPLAENKIEKWEQSLISATSFSQILLHYSTLDFCISWSRSILLASCRICRRMSDSENMLLCDSCNWGHHLYCLKPKLKAIPAGDWFCPRCIREKNLENPPPESPPKKRRIFRDEEVEEEEDESESNKEDSDDEEALDDEEDGDENETESEIADICKICGSGGELVCCDKCSSSFHVECADPPLRRVLRGPWVCSRCKNAAERSRRYYDLGAVVQRTGVMNGQRRCAAKALYKIHDFAKSLRQLSESDDSSEGEAVRKRTRSVEGRTDLPLHNAALHEVLSEIMKDANAWPFLRPVQKTEVPDYYDVITKPMDFGTIKYKLNMGEYHEDAHFMADALLVFQNCNTYNHTDDDVYKCGLQLLKRFQKKCRELGLKLPEEMECDPEERSKKRLRTK